MTKALPPGKYNVMGATQAGHGSWPDHSVADPVDRTCTVPADTQLFFPVVNSIFVITEPGETEEA